MASVTKLKPTYEMTVTDEEARYLLALLQNDLTGSESPSRHAIRVELFNSIKEAMPEYGVR